MSFVLSERETVPMPSTSHHLDEDQASGRLEYEEIGIFSAWKRYGDRLFWGKGQTLALLDDSCDLTIPEWRVTLPWGPKIIAAYNAVEDNDDPSPVPPAYHGTTMGFPSSLYYQNRGGIAFQNHLAPVRCVKRVFIRTDCVGDKIASGEMDTIRRGLEWVLENRARLNITAVNLAVLDSEEDRHSEPVFSDLDDLLIELKAQQVWVSAPCGNHGSSKWIAWPAISPHCFGIGATGPGHHVWKDRNAHTDLLVRAAATSTANAYAAASAMVLREAIEATHYDWKAKGPTLPDAILQIFRETGVPVEDPENGLCYSSLNLLAALDLLLSPSSASRL